MCFYNDNDYDYCPEGWYQSDGPADCEDRCGECEEIIPPGAWRHSIETREFEECFRCERDVLAEDEPPCEECDYGEVWEYARCESCEKILKAIEAQEKSEGCPVEARRPALTELSYALSDCELNYARVAVEMFPELADVPFVRQFLEAENV